MKFGYLYCLLINSATICLGVNLIEGNSNVKKVYDDMMSRLTCPVTNVSNVLTARLSQFTEVNLKNEDDTTIVWLEQVTFTKDAPLKYPGEVTSDWNPPAVCKTSCLINVEYFLLDEQTCFMKFGSWSYDGAQVNFKYKDKFPEKSLVLVDIDLNGCYISVGLELPVETIGWHVNRNREWMLQKYKDMDIKLIVRRKITIGDIINMLLPCLFTFQCFYRLVNEHVQMRALYSEVSD